jgi:hypothetical protein
LLAKFLLKANLNSVNNTTTTMLRHDNDVEAKSKTRHKVLRAVKIQGNNSDSIKSLLIFRGLNKARRRLPSYSIGVPGEPTGGRVCKKYCPHKVANRSPVDVLPSDNEQPGRKFHAGFGNTETFDENCQGTRASPSASARGDDAQGQRRMPRRRSQNATKLRLPTPGQTASAKKRRLHAALKIASVPARSKPDSDIPSQALRGIFARRGKAQLAEDGTLAAASLRRLR